MQQMFRSYKKVRIIYCVEMSLLVNGTCLLERNVDNVALHHV